MAYDARSEGKEHHDAATVFYCVHALALVGICPPHALGWQHSNTLSACLKEQRRWRTGGYICTVFILLGNKNISRGTKQRRNWAVQSTKRAASRRRTWQEEAPARRCREVY